MQRSQVPAKFPIPWGFAATPSFIRPIPENSQIGIQNGAASLTDGFPPLTFVTINEGGVPPFGQDANGILNQLSLWCQWVAAGMPTQYDASFASAIGGYPEGALLNANTVGGLWLSLIDNNTSNPDTGGAGWIPVGARPGRIITSSATLLMNTSDYAIGLNRTASLAAMTINLPTINLPQNYECRIDDLAGNLQRYPATVTPPGGHTIAGENSWTLNVNRQGASFFFYGSSLWGVRSS